MNRAKKISKISGAHRGLVAALDPYAEDPNKAMQGDIAWYRAREDRVRKAREAQQERFAAALRARAMQDCIQ